MNLNPNEVISILPDIPKGNQKYLLMKELKGESK